MQKGPTTWIVTADAREVRVFAEPVRLGPLHEVPALRMRALGGDHPGAPRGTVFQRFGYGRSATGASEPSRAAETQLFRRLGRRLAASAARAEFDRLVLIAPPRALGRLREALPESVLERVEVSDAHDRRDDDAEALRRHLRATRARAAS